MSVVIGLDVGTTGARAVALDGGGAVTAVASAGYEPSSPRPGWSEQDPEVWWRAACEVLADVTNRAGGPVVAVGLAGQMHGAVFLDDAGAVIRPAILWNDQRTEDQCDEIEHRVGTERLVAVTGNRALTGFQAPKILWLRHHDPQAYARVASVLLPKDYVRMRLTGVLATDASDAAGTLLLDLARRDWAPEILDALEIPAEWLPRVHEGPDLTGEVLPSVAQELGWGTNVIVAGGGGDNAAAAIGTGLVQPEVLGSSVGSSGVLFRATEEPRIDPTGRIHAFAHAVPGGYCQLAVTLSAGASLRWWRGITGLDYTDLAAEAAEVPVGADGLLFLPFLTGERTPLLDPQARGSFFGLTARHTRAHLTRAVFDGVGLSLRDGLDLMTGDGVPPQRVVATGGGAQSDLWRQVQADVLELPVQRATGEQGAAYGAAVLGHVAVGTYSSVEQAMSDVVHLDPQVTEPSTPAVRAYGELLDIYRDVYRTTSAQMHALSTTDR